MIIMLLVEVGWIGLIMFGALMAVLSGIGVWRISAKNLYLFASIMLPILLILIESHSLFTRRYFALHLVLLYFITQVLMNPKRKQP